MLRLAQPQVQMWGKCSTAVFPRCLCSERSCQRFPLFLRITGQALLPRITSSPCVATVYDKLTGGGGCWCVLTSLYGSSFMHDLSSVCCLFHHLSLPEARFLGQAYSGGERPVPKHQVLSYHSKDKEQ
jgi:hypothetical protein